MGIPLSHADVTMPKQLADIIQTRSTLDIVVLLSGQKVNVELDILWALDGDVGIQWLRGKSVGQSGPIPVLRGNWGVSLRSIMEGCCKGKGRGRSPGLWNLI